MTTWKIAAVQADCRLADVPASGGSDHALWLDPSVGVPCPMLIQWPDRYYHTDHDTPDRCDPDSLALAVHAGVDFPLGVARLAEQGDVEPLAPGRPGVRCRWFVGDARHLFSVWRGPPAGYPAAFPSRLRTTVAVLIPSIGTQHDNFALTDPMPELGDWLHFLGRTLPRALSGKLKRRVHD